MKFCKRCLETKGLDEFGNDRSRPDGKDFYCRACRRKGCPTTIEPPSHRRCNKCKEVKPITKFNRTKKRRDGRDTTCMFCNAPHRKKGSPAYARAKDKAKQWNKTKRIENKSLLCERLGGRCEDCGISPGAEWPLACFDIHHEDPAGKEFDFARLMATATLNALLAESDKCTLLCANCHRRRHAAN